MNFAEYAEPDGDERAESDGDQERDTAGRAPTGTRVLIGSVAIGSDIAGALHLSRGDGSARR